MNNLEYKVCDILLYDTEIENYKTIIISNDHYEDDNNHVKMDINVLNFQFIENRGFFYKSVTEKTKPTNIVLSGKYKGLEKSNYNSYSILYNESINDVNITKYDFLYMINNHNNTSVLLLLNEARTNRQISLRQNSFENLLNK